MKNDKFWNECTNGSIRQKIAEFIDATPTVSHLKNEAYYDFEDALVEFIYENRDRIFNEVDLEYQREDFLAQATNVFGEDIEEVVKTLPIDVIDSMISQWQEALIDNDNYWDITWSELSNVLTDGNISPLVGIDNYPVEKVLIYAAYLKEWYSDMSPERQGQSPACIDDFYNNEMTDDELSEYYIKSAKKLFGDKIKDK